MSEAIQRIRKEFPDLDKYGYSDEEVALWLADSTGRDRQEVGEMLGVYDPDQGDFGRGIDSAIDSTQAMGYAAGALVADSFGADDARNNMIRGYQKNMAQVAQRARPTDTIEGINSFGDALDFTQYYSGYGLAQGAQALASGGLGSLIGKQIVKQGIKRAGKDLLSDASKKSINKGGKIGGYTGIGGQAITTELGATYGGAVDKTLAEGGSVDSINTAPVYGYGTLAGMAEGLSDVATLGLARFGPAKDLIKTARKSRLGTAAVRGTQGAIVEGVTEGIQTGLEDLGAGYSAEEARFFDPTAVAAGVIGGGQLGIAGGVLTRPQQSKTDLNEIKEEVKTEVGEQLGLDLNDPNSVEQYKAQQEQVRAQAEKEAENQKEQQDAENEVLRVEALEFSKKEFKKQMDAGLELSIDDKTSELGKRFNEILNTPTEDNPRGLLDDDDIKTARKEFIKVVKEEQASGFNTAYEAELSRRVAEKVKNEGQIELDFDQQTQDEKTQTAMAMPVRTQKTAIAKAKALFGEDFINNPDYADLAAEINAKKFNVKKFNTQLDKIVSPKPPVTATAQPQAAAATTTQLPGAAVTTATEKPVNALLNNEELRSKLTPQQNQVYDTFLEAINNKTADDLINVQFDAQQELNDPRKTTLTPEEKAKGKKLSAIGLRKVKKDPRKTGSRTFEITFNTPELRKRSGIKNPSSAKTSATNFVREFKKIFTPEQVREALAQAGITTGVGETFTNQQTQQFLSETGGEVATVNSPGGTQTEGAGSKTKVTQEEKKAFKKAGMSNEAINAIDNKTAADLENEQADFILQEVKNARFAVERSDKLLRQTWTENTAKDGPSYDDLSMENKIDWMHTIFKFLGSQRTEDDFNTVVNKAESLRQLTDTGPTTEGNNNDNQDNQVGRTEVQTTDQNQTSADLQENAQSGPQTNAPATGNTGDFTAGENRVNVPIETRKKKVLTKTGDKPTKLGVTQEIFEPTVAQKALAKAKFSNTQLTNTSKITKPTTRNALETQIKKLTGEKSNIRIHVFNTEAEAIAAINNGTVPPADVKKIQASKPFGFVTEDNAGDPHAHFILDRIPEGGELAAFMHEVGGHVGIDSIIDPDQQLELAQQIFDWADVNNNSTESKIARRAMARVNFANKDGNLSDSEIISEAIAYFLEEASLAGIEPSVDSSIGQFLQQLKDLFVAALNKLGIETADLTTQNVVDLAFGAARIELMHGQTPTHIQKPFTSPSAVANTNLGVARDWVGENLGGKTALSLYDNAAEVGRIASRSVKFVHQIVRENRDIMPALGRWYDGMLKIEETRNEIKRLFQPIRKQVRELGKGRLAVVNKFLGESTFDQKWGYDPKEFHPDVFVDKQVKIDPTKQEQFNKFSQEEKQLVANIFAHGERMRQRKVALAKMLGVGGSFFSDAGLEGPYAPLKRFGNYVGELKSARLKQAETKAKVKGASKKAKDEYEKLKSDPDHYVISFFDTSAMAKQFAEANKSKFIFSGWSERKPSHDSDRVSSPEVYEKVMGALAASKDADMDATAKTAFRAMIKNMYFQSLDERSARTSGARRLNRAGYEPNMVRSFLSQATSEATMIAHMENGAEINTAFRDAENSVVDENNDVDREKQFAFNTISRHYNSMLTRAETPIQDRITVMNSVYMLLTSVGYHLTNATQPAMVTVPRIAGDFADYTGTWSGLFRGYKQARQATGIGANLELNIDLTKVAPQYKRILEIMRNRNLIDQGMEEDGTFDRFNTGYESLNRASDTLGTITSKLYNVAKFVEAQNRISTAVAAYDMAKANPTKLAEMNMTAEEYAIAVVEDTQGDFSQLDAPLLIKWAPKIVTQYRKYQLLMAWHYTNGFNQTFRGETPQMKAAGRRVLGYSLAHAAMGAGATGVPLSGFAFWVATMLTPGGDDEPQDMERWIKENIDDGVLGTILSRGVFTTFGLDLSTKLNQSKIFHPLPYTDFTSGEAGAQDILMGLVGPAGTTGVNFFRAAEYYKQGDLLKGIEYSVPKGIRSVAESYRLATEGYTTRAGTVLVDPREIDTYSLLVNAMGIPSTEVNRIKWTRGQQYELEQYFSNESSKIRKNYIEAFRARDGSAMKELREDWRELQKGKDRVRPFFNNVSGVLKRQSVSALIKAPRTRAKLEKKEQAKLAD
jgi:hypothetical protein